MVRTFAEITYLFALILLVYFVLFISIQPMQALASLVLDLAPNAPEPLPGSLHFLISVSFLYPQPLLHFHQFHHQN
jgi:hypothetical protein